MSERAAPNAELQESIGRARVLLPVEGATLLLLGATAILLPGLAAIAVTILLGWLFFFSGVVGLIVTLGAPHLPGYRWSLVSALIALAAGAFLTIWPIREAATIRLLLGAFFAVDGIFSIMYAGEHRRLLSGRWVLMVASGAFSLLLGAYVLSGMPLSLGWFGTVVGIDMVFAGAALVAIAAGLKAVA